MKLITNPTDTAIQIQFAGQSYSIAPKSTESFNDDVVAFWADLHKFLVVSEKVEKKEVVQEVAKTEEKVVTKKK